MLEAYIQQEWGVSVLLAHFLHKLIYAAFGAAVGFLLLAAALRFCWSWIAPNYDVFRTMMEQVRDSAEVPVKNMDLELLKIRAREQQVAATLVVANMAVRLSLVFAVSICFALYL